MSLLSLLFSSIIIYQISWSTLIFCHNFMVGFTVILGNCYTHLNHAFDAMCGMLINLCMSQGITSEKHVSDGLRRPRWMAHMGNVLGLRSHLLGSSFFLIVLLIDRVIVSTWSRLTKKNLWLVVARDPFGIDLLLICSLIDRAVNERFVKLVKLMSRVCI
jgi:hypothetical protein